MIGIRIRKTNARSAKQMSYVLSATRNFVPTGERGVYFMECLDEVQAVRDADFLLANRLISLSDIDVLVEGVRA